MKVLHCCLSCFYIDDFGYQENILPVMHQEDGNDVWIIASTETYVDGALTTVKPADYSTKTGIPIKRIPYMRFAPEWIARKLRIHPAFRKALYAFEPDVILFHGVCGYELLTAARYKAAHPSVTFFVDSHEDAQNSAKTWLSRNTLYRFWYGPILKRAYKHIDRILCVSDETIDFLQDRFHLPQDKMEFYPLGGMIPAQSEYDAWRGEVRSELGVRPSTIVCILSGKLTPRKRAGEVIEGIRNLKRDDVLLLIIGKPDAANEEIIRGAVDSDARIRYLGWKPEADLRKYLCGGDVYIQLGTQSATTQSAMCSSCAVLLYPHKSHKRYLKGNGAFIENAGDITRVMEGLTQDAVREMCSNSYELANEVLNYRVLARRIYPPSYSGITDKETGHAKEE